MCLAKCINSNECRNADELSTFYSFMIKAKCKLEKDKEKVSTSELGEFAINEIRIKLSYNRSC